MSWPEPVRRVAAVLEQAAAEARLEEFPDGAPTAEAAARALGCKLAQIIRSLVVDGEWFAHFAFFRPPLDLGSDRSTMLACPSRRRPRFAYCQVQWA